MGRWTQRDEDDHGLEDMTCEGYDADSQTYTYRDNNDGSYWETEPGNRYGKLHKVGAGSDDPRHDHMYSDHPVVNTRPSQDEPPPYESAARRPDGSEQDPAAYTRENPYRIMAPFLLLVCLVLLLLFRLLNSSSPSDTAPSTPFTCGELETIYHVRQADTCWDIARQHRTSVNALQDMNRGVDCDKLRIGQKLCVPIIEDE